MRLRALVLSLLLPCVSAPSIVLAQPAQTVSDGDKAAARELTIDGYASLERKDYADAEAKFARAYALYRAPTITLGLARAKAGLGRLIAAQELYNHLVREQLPPDATAAFVHAVADARTDLAALEPRIPSLIIEVRGAEAPRVLLDGVAVPAAVLGIKRPVDPGRHVVRAVASRFLPREVTVTVTEGKVETVTLDLMAAPPGTPDPPELAGFETGSPGGSVRRPIGFAALGVGGAGLVVGAVTAGLTASKRSSLLQQCPTRHCLPSQQPALQPEVNDMNTLAAVSTGTFIAGGVLAAAGVILVATAPRATPQATGVVPVVGPGFVGLVGRFW
jgi:hypothetical protein